MLKRSSDAKPTDWDQYYARPYPTASITRSISQRLLLAAMERHVPAGATIAELGGGNSCFYEAINQALRPRRYEIFDTNKLGLTRFQERFGNPQHVGLHHQDARLPASEIEVDLVFSVGLIEHFDEAGTRELVKAHFDRVKPGGIVLITFPTPTWLYRVSRFVSEAIGAWIFHDERPLQFEEVAEAGRAWGELLERRIVWPIFFTQYHMVWRKTVP